MIQRFLLVSCILFLIASCGISQTSSHFSYGDRSVPAYFPKRVALQLCDVDPSVRLEMTDALVKNLTSAGIEVMEPVNSDDTTGLCRSGTLPGPMKQELRENLGIQGFFVGMLEQRRVEPILLTRFQLKLVGNPGGKLIWITDVKTDHLAAVIDAKRTAVKASEIAVDSFKKDVLEKSR